MFNFLVQRFLRWACRPERVYRKGHLRHADGTLYMGRWALFETHWLSARVHHIASDDYDRAMHDHPWPFVSVVLSGSYDEVRPVRNDENDWYEGDFFLRDFEVSEVKWRAAGSIAYRRPTDRHLVKNVRPNTYTLFIYGPARQWWGFYTRQGKIHWQDFQSVHKAITSEGTDHGEQRSLFG